MGNWLPAEVSFLFLKLFLFVWLIFGCRVFPAVRASPICGKRGLLFPALCRLLIAVASLLQSAGSRALRLQGLWLPASVQAP